MRRTCLVFSLGALAFALVAVVAPGPGGSPARAAQKAAAAPASLRELSGNVGVVDRAGAPLGPYLDKLDGALWLERARGTAGPYVVSVANSLEALDPKERAEGGGRGDRLLLAAHLVLAQFSGPQGGRLMQLYAAGLGQLVGARPDEVTLTEETRRELRQIGAYATAAAGRLIERLPAAARAEAKTELALALGRYGEAAGQARAWEKVAPSPLSRAHLLGAQLLAGQGAAAAPLHELERQGGPGGHLAWLLSRRAAREALTARLGKALAAAAMPADVRKALGAAGKPDEPAVREACQVLIKPDLKADAPKGAAPGAEAAAPDARAAAGAAKDPALTDCLVLLLESPRSEWARHPALAAPEASPRQQLLRLAAQLGALLGLPGRGPSPDAAERARALDEVTRLAPVAKLPPEDAEALLLLAQIAAAQKPEVPAALHPGIDRYLKGHACSPLGLPLFLARFPVAQRAAALGEAVTRCSGGEPRDAEALRQLAVQILALTPGGPGADAAAAALERLGKAPGGAPGGGRFLLAAADGAAVRLLARKAPAIDDAALAAAGRRYAEASAALTPWDGPEARGRAEVQQAALLLRRYQLQPRAEILDEAQGHLRFAMLLPAGDEALVAQAVDQALVLEALRANKQPVPAPQADLATGLGRLPASTGRRALACVVLQQARAARDNAAAARLAPLGGADPLPEVAAFGQVRLTTSVGVDERLRVGTRGEVGITTPPRCSPR